MCFFCEAEYALIYIQFKIHNYIFLLVKKCKRKET